MIKRKKFTSDEIGATAIEYGVLAGVIGIGLVGIAHMHNSFMRSGFTKLADNLSTVAGLS